MAMLLFLGWQALALSVHVEYVNANDLGFVQQSFGVGVGVDILNVPIQLGVQQLATQAFGTVHQPINQTMIIGQDHLVFPVSFSYRWVPRSKIYIQPSIGLMVFTPMNSGGPAIDAINQHPSIIGEPVIQNYKETVSPSIFYKLQFSYRVWPQWRVSFAKTWSKITSTSSFTYLNQYPVKKESVFHYDPISVSVAYHF